MDSYETDGNRVSRASALAAAIVHFKGNLDNAFASMTQPAPHAGEIGPLRHPNIHQSTLIVAANLLRRQGHEGYAAILSEYENKNYPPRGRSF